MFNIHKMIALPFCFIQSKMLQLIVLAAMRLDILGLVILLHQDVEDEHNDQTENLNHQ